MMLVTVSDFEQFLKIMVFVTKDKNGGAMDNQGPNNYNNNNGQESDLKGCST